MHSQFLFLSAAIAILSGVANAASDNSHLNHLRDTHRHRSKLANRSTSLPSGWSLQSACLTDKPSPNRLLTSSSNDATGLTPASCVAKCNAQGYTFAAVQFGIECWCGGLLNTDGGAGVKAATSECNMGCAGDASQTCGGNYYLTLYSKSSGGGSSSAAPSATKSATSVHPTATVGPSKYKLNETYSGQSFFDKWNFFTSNDPTGGLVNYQSKSNAQSKGLAYVQDDGVAVIKVDDKTWLNGGQNRDSVRITSKSSYTTGLLVFDVVEMPYGCSVWPALWTVGPNWPNNGEIDIIEGVNNGTVNQMTLHTGAGTTCTTSGLNPKDVSAGFMSKTCASTPSANAGCGFQDPDPSSYGVGFNNIGGAVLALLIDNTGTKIWRFPRGSIPADISAQKPNPDSWGTPGASFPSSDSCKTSEVIKNQQIVLDITLCGGWAGDAYSSSGCPGTCAERILDPSNFKTASWKVKSINVYH